MTLTDKLALLELVDARQLDPIDVAKELLWVIAGDGEIPAMDDGGVRCQAIHALRSLGEEL